MNIYQFPFESRLEKIKFVCRYEKVLIQQKKKKMTRQIIYVAAICVLLSFCAVAKSDLTVGDSVKLQTQLHADIFLLKEGVEVLQTSMEILTKKSNNQIDLLKQMQSEAENEKSDQGVCGQLSSFFNGTYRKYNMLEERIIGKLEEIQDEQTTNHNKLLVRRNQPDGCQKGLDSMSLALSVIIGKIDQFEKELKSFQTLEENLKEQQSTFQTVNNAQMKILQEISEKLSLHHGRFDNVEKQLSDLKVVAEVAGSAPPRKMHKLPIGVVSGTGQGLFDIRLGSKN